MEQPRMNEWCIYIALYCVLLYTQSASQSCERGGGIFLFFYINFILGVLRLIGYQSLSADNRIGMQGLQNFKIPGSPSGRYSDFGSPIIKLTQIKDHICQSKTFLIYKYQRISRKGFYLTIYRVKITGWKIIIKIFIPFRQGKFIYIAHFIHSGNS